MQARTYPYYILHIRSHTNLPGSITEGNTRAVLLASPDWVAPQPDMLAQEKALHNFFHLSARALQQQFQLPNTDAHNIVSICADCQGHAAPLQMGVSPHGLRALQVWQTDVTHIPEFGHLKYTHVSTDSFFSVIWATVHRGKRGWDAIAHWQSVLQLWAFLKPSKLMVALYTLHRKPGNFYSSGVYDTKLASLIYQLDKGKWKGHMVP
ncbi:Endogenous retrovirus group K member 25 Pol protein [Lonchura striata]|uniref:Endogenous retrovirus group K member 25 Pol protein n=1 Tax=Lonchura striata TaxID=40157 RepID=A0A218U8Q6_9PASE|nr:Endogenous retrovirus group K member 25 Pol protein [Lonchura striata domestica]